MIASPKVIKPIGFFREITPALLPDAVGRIKISCSGN